MHVQEKLSFKIDAYVSQIVFKLSSTKLRIDLWEPEFQLPAMLNCLYREPKRGADR